MSGAKPPVGVPIQLTRGFVAMVDEVDADLAGLKWCALESNRTFYAQRGIWRNGRQASQSLHQVVARRMGIVGEADHKDRDGLNNRRSNLRPANRSQQGANRGLQSNSTSGLKGASWNKDNRKWQAHMGVNGKMRHLGYHATAVGAALAYDRAAPKAFGEFAFLNFRVDPRTEALIAGCRP